MCKFFSAIGMKNGDILYKDGLDSHSDLIDFFDLPDDRECRHFVKLEFYPKAGMEHDIEEYSFRIDEETAPIWTEDVVKSFEMKSRNAVSRMIVTNHARLISSESIIIGPGARIGMVKNSRVYFMNGGKVFHIDKCNVDKISGGKINYISNSTVNDISGGEIDHVSSSTVSYISGGNTLEIELSVVGRLSGGRIEHVGDGAFLGVASGGSIRNFRGLGAGQLRLGGCNIENMPTNAICLD
jgi:hypothetical protein